MLTWLASYPSMFDTIAGYITPEDFVTPLYHRAAELVFVQHEEGAVNPARLLNQFSDPEEQGSHRPFSCNPAFGRGGRGQKGCIGNCVPFKEGQHYMEECTSGPDRPGRAAANRRGQKKAGGFGAGQSYPAYFL